MKNIINISEKAMFRKVKKLIKNSNFYEISMKIYWYLFYPVVLWMGGIRRTQPKKRGVKNCAPLDGVPRVIVSLTSFPSRTKYVYKTINTILNQTYKPDMVILVLSSDQFPNKELDLPDRVVGLKKYGLTIMWVQGDMKSYKKLIPILLEYPNDIIITADDDLYYPKDWIESLMISYKIDSKKIHCHLVTFVDFVDGIVRFSGSYRKRGNGMSSCKYKILGGSGTLYPPNSFPPDVFNENIFMRLAPTNDDLWFWAMAIMHGTEIKWIRNNMKRLYYVEETQVKTPCLYTQNNIGPNLRLKQLYKIDEEYGILSLIKEPIAK